MSAGGDLVLLNGRVLTMRRPGHYASAVAVRGDRIAAVGSDREALAIAGPDARTFDLGGASVVPGFVDSHCHLVQTGRGLLGPSARRCRTVQDVRDTVRRAAELEPWGTPLVVQGCALGSLDEPLRGNDVDGAAPHHPVLVGDVELHSAVLNRAGWDLAGLDDATVPDADAAARSVHGAAHTLARRRFYDELGDDVRARAARAAAQRAISRGVTTVHAIEGRDAFGWRDLEVARDEAAAARLPTSLVLWSQASDLMLAAGADVRGVADLWVDGAYSDRSAALLAPYADAPDSRGSLYYSDDALGSLVRETARLGLEFAPHAIGDAAIEQTLNAYERARAHDWSDGAHPRIEHFSLPTPEHLERAARLGVVASVQPALLAGTSPGAARALGPERALRRHPYRSMREAGIEVCGGSDSDFGPLDPLLGVQAAVAHPNPGQALTAYEALEMFTVAPARASRDDKAGTLEVGKRADLVVLESDPATAAAARLGELKIRLVMVAGQPAWGTLDAFSPVPSAL